MPTRRNAGPEEGRIMKIFSKWLLLLAVPFVLIGCSGTPGTSSNSSSSSSGGSTGGTTAGTFSIGGTVAGLTGSGMVLAG